MSGVHCNQCGHKNPDGANFCSSCGEVLESGSHEHTTITLPTDRSAESGDDEVVIDLDRIPSEVGVLVVKRGGQAGARYTLERTLTTAGRHPESDIFLDDITVSRRHAEIVREGDHYLVRDAGSLNGTYLNRERIGESVSLANGDELQVGKFKLVFFQGAGDD
jgi:pSer/pThr/pTyr-binding forkhead associated (FHA) protein